MGGARYVRHVRAGVRSTSIGENSRGLGRADRLAQRAHLPSRTAHRPRRSMTATTPETAAAAPRRIRWRRPPGKLTRRQQAAMMNVLFVIAAVVVLVFMPEEGVLIAPALALCGVALWFLTTLWAREGTPPVFESGTMWALATTVYGMIPMIGFAMMGGQWSEFVDGRLTAYVFN